MLTDVMDATPREAALSPAARTAPLQPIPGAELAREIGATGHAVFTIARGARGRELAGVLGLDFPKLPPAVANQLIHAALNSMKPLWWAHGDAPDLDGLRWACRLEGALPGPAGLAFPVAAAGDGAGLVLFVGRFLSFTDRTLPDLHRRCFELFRATALRSDASFPGTPSLAKRELECIRLAADGMTSEEIARALRLSLHTANQYLADAARKLNASGRMHAVAKALRLGLID